MSFDFRWLHDLWLRRYWREDPKVTELYRGLRPVVLITGGSEGIGFALAQQFAAAGKELLLIARHRDRLEAAQAKLQALKPKAVHVLALDVTRADATTIIDTHLASLGAFADELVNNAGIGISGAFAECAQDNAMALIDLNIRALAGLTRHYLPGMLARGRGGIINLSSVGGYGPGPNQALYYASKAFVLSLTEAIGYETAGQGVRVCAVAPGPVSTRFHSRMGAERAFYRVLMPPTSAALVGWLTYKGYRLGMRVVWPGLLTPAFALGMRLTPHRILNPIVGLLLRPRR